MYNKVNANYDKIINTQNTCTTYYTICTTHIVVFTYTTTYVVLVCM